MVSSQLSHAAPALDEVISQTDPDFTTSGLKVPSVIRICRLAVVDRRILLGAVGDVSAARLDRIRRALVQWIGGACDR